MKIFITGINGFIGVNLLQAILDTTDWQVIGFDISDSNISQMMQNDRLEFIQGDIYTSRDIIQHCVQKSDVVIPLVAIANPLLYVQKPLEVFQLDFEENLKIVYDCITYKKRLVFPSTSEVYGMCTDRHFDEDTSNFVTGPINKPRWIYATSKQMLDRVIYAAGVQQGLQYTLFRPFNFIGPYQDNPFSTGKQNRAIPTFISNVLYGQHMTLVNGGGQQRCFVYIKDAIGCILKIIANKQGVADNQIFNIGASDNEYSIREIAEMVLNSAEKISGYSDVRHRIKLRVEHQSTYYGTGYQDMQRRVPSIHKARDLLGWTPTTDIATAIDETVRFYLQTMAGSKNHLPYKGVT